MQYMIDADFIEEDELTHALSEGKAKELVLCKDCVKHHRNTCKMYWIMTPDDWYCADGQPEEADDGAIEPIMFMEDSVKRFRCGNCGKYLVHATYGRDDFCSKCGKKVKWHD